MSITNVQKPPMICRSFYRQPFTKPEYHVIIITEISPSKYHMKYTIPRSNLSRNLIIKPGYIFVGIITSTVFMPLHQAYAQTSHILNAGGNEIATRTRLGSKSPIEVMAVLINAVLGVLAVIAMVLIVYAGFSWMTSGGNEEKVKKARGTLLHAFIGLTIIMAAWGITKWMIGLIAGAAS